MNRDGIRFITPAVTPIESDGSIDIESALSLYEYLIDGHIDGILIFGSIGEFFSFTLEEKKELIREAIRSIDKRCYVIVGISSMVYSEAVELAHFSFSMGADSLMAVSPYYFYLDDSGAYDYYMRLSHDAGGPLFIYNFPDRMGYSIEPSVIKSLAMDSSNIIGIKDTIKGMDHTREIIKAVKEVREDFLVYSGFDDNFAHNVLSGGNGCISGLSNIFPGLASKWADSMRNDDIVLSSMIQKEVNRLMDIYSVAPYFIPVIKEALKRKGIIKNGAATFPFTSPKGEELDRLYRILDDFDASEIASLL